MKKAVEFDLADLSDILEGFVTKLPKMSQHDLIDLAARLKPVAKNTKAIDDFVKVMVKEKLKHKEGMLPGGLFKAVLKLVPIGRLDQKALKEDKPALVEEYTRDDTDERVTFEVK